MVCGNDPSSVRDSPYFCVPSFCIFSEMHFGHGTSGPVGNQYMSQAIRRKCAQHPTRRYDNRRLRHPLPGYLLWRGNHSKYQYQSYQTAKYGEGEAQKEYHSHFAHAKDPMDSCKANEMEYIIKSRAIPEVLPLPKPQVPTNSVPKWHWKSWHMPYTSVDIWRRELEYPEHIPTHRGEKYSRPLCVLAPKIKYRQLQGQFIKEIAVTICPFVFGYGETLQGLVMAFYRIATNFRNIMHKKQVQLKYALEPSLPVIEVTWVDGSVYQPPLLEGSSPYDIVQNIMQESFLVQDRVYAQNIKPPEGDYPDLGLWGQILEYKLSKKAKLALSQEETEKADAEKQTKPR